MTKPQFTTLEMEAALCLWEAALDLRSDETAPCYAELNADLENYGSFQARHSLAIDRAAQCERLWQSLTEKERDCVVFDWEFCPAFIVAYYATGNGSDAAMMEAIRNRLSTLSLARGAAAGGGIVA